MNIILTEKVNKNMINIIGYYLLSLTYKTNYLRLLKDKTMYIHYDLSYNKYINNEQTKYTNGLKNTKITHIKSDTSDYWTIRSKTDI